MNLPDFPVMTLEPFTKNKMVAGGLLDGGSQGRLMVNPSKTVKWRSSLDLKGFNATNRNNGSLLVN